MLPRKFGRIVNIASAASRKGGPTGTHYAASKFGVIGLSQSIALNVAKEGIRINCVCPGFVHTNILDRLFKGMSQTQGITEEQAAQAIYSKIPMGIPQLPEDIGNAALFLCSDLSDKITGQALNVDGAFRMN